MTPEITTPTPGVYEISFPIPMAVRQVNIYAWQEGDGWILVDCGPDTDECFAYVTSALRDIGCTSQDLKHIIVTHSHPDHFGMAFRLQEWSQAIIWLHKEEWDQFIYYKTHQEEFSRRAQAWLEEGGVPATEMVLLLNSYLSRFLLFSPSAPRANVRLIAGEETPPGWPARGWRVLMTPGHSYRHISLYHEERKLFLAGDHILGHITPNIGFHPLSSANPLTEYLQSLERIRRMDPEMALPAHGRVITGVAARLEAIREQHRQRSRAILAALNRPKTINELVPAIFPNDLDPQDKRLAIMEIGAHLQWLQTEGQVAEATSSHPRQWLKAGNFNHSKIARER